MTDRIKDRIFNAYIFYSVVFIPLGIWKFIEIVGLVADFLFLTMQK